MDECGLGVLELLRDVACQSEVGVLVDRTWNKARNVGHVAKYMGEGAGERGCGLDGTEMNLPDAVSDETKRFSPSHS